MKYRGSVLLLLPALLLGACVVAHAQEAAGTPTPTPRDERLERILEKVGEGVARYQAGLFSIAFGEMLRREELREDMTAKKSKEYVFDTIVLRESLSADEEDYYPLPVRRLKSIDGKPSKKRLGPEVSYFVSSLGFLLPKHRSLFQFTFDGEVTEAGRKLYRIRMLSPGEGEPRVEWKRRVVGFNFRVVAPLVYMIWVDTETFDVLRLESHLAAPFEFDSPRAFGPFGHSRHFKYAVHDYFVSFRRQQFKDPEQTLLVPDSAEWVTVIEGASKPRTRATLRFNNYQRFRSDVKVIEEPDN
jgi:hypothetical protein